MATQRGLALRVMGEQRQCPSARGGSFTNRGAGRGSRVPEECPISHPEMRPAHLEPPMPAGDVPGAGLEPARPRGAARFKLAVSAFHHPGTARDAALAQEPIGTHHSNSRVTTRCCLILLTSEGASAHVPAHPHMPGADGHLVTRLTGMTKSRRPVTQSASCRGRLRGRVIPEEEGAPRRSDPRGPRERARGRTPRAVRGRHDGVVPAASPSRQEIPP